MDKNLTRYDSLSAMKDAQLRDWQNRPGYERVAAISEITTAAYEFKNGGAPNVSGLQRTLIQVKRAQS